MPVPSAEYKAFKAEYGDYRQAVAEWDKLTGEKFADSFRAKLQHKQQQVKNRIVATSIRENIIKGKII